MGWQLNCTHVPETIPTLYPMHNTSMHDYTIPVCMTIIKLYIIMSSDHHSMMSCMRCDTEERKKSSRSEILVLGNIGDYIWMDGNIHKQSLSVLHNPRLHSGIYWCTYCMNTYWTNCKKHLNRVLFCV